MKHCCIHCGEPIHGAVGGTTITCAACGKSMIIPGTGGTSRGEIGANPSDGGRSKAKDIAIVLLALLLIALLVLLFLRPDQPARRWIFGELDDKETVPATNHSVPSGPAVTVPSLPAPAANNRTYRSYTTYGTYTTNNTETTFNGQSNPALVATGANFGAISPSTGLPVRGSSEFADSTSTNSSSPVRATDSPPPLPTALPGRLASVPDTGSDSPVPQGTASRTPTQNAASSATGFPAAPSSDQSLSLPNPRQTPAPPFSSDSRPSQVSPPAPISSSPQPAQPNLLSPLPSVAPHENDSRSVEPTPSASSETDQSPKERTADLVGLVKAQPDDAAKDGKLSSAQAVANALDNQSKQSTPGNQSPANQSQPSANPSAPSASQAAQPAAAGPIGAAANSAAPPGELAAASTSGGQGPIIAQPKYGDGKPVVHPFDPEHGSNVVFVVDNSASMNGEKSLVARRELANTLEQLGPNKSFYILFFPLKAMPAPGPLPATPENVQTMTNWLFSVRHGSGSDPTEAMLRGLGLRPDTLWLLSDGEFSHKVPAMIRLANETIQAHIHTVGLYSRKGEAVLKQIADQNGGTYRFVPPRER